MFKKKILSLIYLILFSTFLINFFIINQFNGLGTVAFISNDEIYLIEQLLSKIKKNYIVFNADSAEYGIEFIYLSKIIYIFDIFFDLEEITIYKIISTIHLLFFIGSNFVILKIFELVKINIKLCLLFVTFNCFNIFFIQSFFSLKPDFNVVFFLITLSYYFLIRFNLTNKKFFLNFSIFSASVAFCVKIWGFIMLIPIIYCAIKNKKNINLSFPFKSFFIFSILIILYLVYLLYSLENYLINNPQYNYFFQNFNIFKDVSFYDLLLPINSFIFVIIFIFLLFALFLHKIKIKNREVILSLDIFFKFTFISLILLIPYVIDFEKFIRSAFFFSKSLIFNQILENNFYSNLINIMNNFYNLNYIYLILYIIVLSSYIKFFLKKKIIFSKEYIVFFYASLQIFIFYFFYRKFNIGSNIAIVLLLITLIIFIDNNKKFFENKSKYYLSNIFLILIIIFPFKDNFYSYYYNQISTFGKIEKLKKNIASYLDTENKKHYNLLICRKNLSFLASDKTQILSHKECKKISKLSYKKNHLLILRSDQIIDHYNQEIKNLIQHNSAYLLKNFNYSINWSNYIYKEQIKIYELKNEQK